MILQIMLVLCGSAALGKPIITVQFNPLFIESMKGWKANEEKYLQTNLNFEKWFEEEKKAKWEMEAIHCRQNEYRKCCCKDARDKEQIAENATCFYHQIFKYTHWLREKLTSTEAQKEELKILIESVQAIVKVVETTYQHEKTEWELSNPKEVSENEDYEIINKGILELEQETTQWKNILAELESKLNSLQTPEQQTQILQTAALMKKNN